MWSSSLSGDTIVLNFELELFLKQMTLNCNQKKMDEKHNLLYVKHPDIYSRTTTASRDHLTVVDQ